MGYCAERSVVAKAGLLRMNLGWSAQRFESCVCMYYMYVISQRSVLRYIDLRVRSSVIMNRKGAYCSVLK